MKHEFNSEGYNIIHVEITARCNVCDYAQVIKTTANDIIAWGHGYLAQEVFDYLAVDERELLISKTCGQCFDKIYPQLEE
jgi:hypothetical protein